MNKRIILELIVLGALLPIALLGQVVVSPSGSAGAPFIDSAVLVFGSSDATKGIRFEVDTNVTTGTTVILTVPAASGTLVTTAAAQTFTSQITFSTSFVAGREYVSGFTPTCTSTGLGTGSAAIEAGSTDLAGVCVLSPTGSPGANGAITLTFSTGSAYTSGSATPICIATLASGATAWGNDSGVYQTTFSTTAPVLTWSNGTYAGGATNITASTTYKVNYTCIGR